ncbi:MAG: AAA family ATPase [Trueperaceae bacterium]|nr:AAA family ATPase [Trueperaceae bacterium]
MAITRLRLENFTAFEGLELTPSPGINAFIGTNATGKTHLMKVLYAACAISKTQDNFAEKLIRVFLPSKRKLGRLVRRQPGTSRCVVEIERRAPSHDTLSLRASFSTRANAAKSAEIDGAEAWFKSPVESVYIPVKEMLANAPGFRSLYAQREIYFEEIYADILDHAYLPPLRGRMDERRRRLLGILQEEMDGKVRVADEEFFLKSQRGDLEFSLLAEGVRKLGLLWLLIQNGTLLEGSVLFWDEPETNLNPVLFGMVVDILLELQRQGVQVFLATHDYVLAKELDLRQREDDRVQFTVLYRPEEAKGRVVAQTAARFAGLEPNPIMEAFANLYDRQVEHSLKDLV